MFCRSIGGAGGAALISNFSGLLVAARVAGELDLAVGIDHDLGVDALDAVLDAVAQVGEYDRAVGHT